MPVTENAISKKLVRGQLSKRENSFSYRILIFSGEIISNKTKLMSFVKVFTCQVLQQIKPYIFFLALRLFVILLLLKISFSWLFRSSKKSHHSQSYCVLIFSGEIITKKRKTMVNARRDVTFQQNARANALVTVATA